MVLGEAVSALPWTIAYSERIDRDRSETDMNIKKSYGNQSYNIKIYLATFLCHEE